MKNQIQKLAEQAKKSVPHGLSPDKWIEVYNEKFAELMVRECSLFVFKQNGPKSALNLLEHFGVEQ